jgi:hypothetical protein
MSPVSRFSNHQRHVVVEPDRHRDDDALARWLRTMTEPPD